MSAINLSQVPAPNVVEPLDYEAILAAMRDDLAARDPELVDLPESDPAMKVLEVAAYRELLVRQRVNEAAQAVMLTYARKKDLDNLAALFDVQRLIIQEADPEAHPPVSEVKESDPDFRRRIGLSLDGLSVAGPASAYRYHALSADGQVMDAGAHSPEPGEVIVTVLARTGDGTADQILLDTVDAAVSAEDTRPLTDQVTVASATIVNYSIEATLYTYAGPDSSVVMAEAQAAIEQYADDTHRLGYDVTLSGVYAALHRAGVQHVELTQPTATVTIDPDEAPHCTGITLTYGGNDE